MRFNRLRNKGLRLARVSRRGHSPIHFIGFGGTTEQLGEKVPISDENERSRPSWAEARFDSIGFMRGLKPPPPSEKSFSPSCEVVPRKKQARTGRSTLQPAGKPALQFRLSRVGNAGGEPVKKQKRMFNKTGGHGVLRNPTHRTKTSDEWGTVSSIAGRWGRWTTDTKP
jgi:hypothetical protein